MKKVTVIMPSFNRAEYISGAIDSVLNQSYQDCELIIVDDGSTDNTKSILAKYPRNYPNQVKIIYSENEGAGEARNKGLRQANGNYVAFLDSDDEWEPLKLEKQLAVFKKNPEIGLIFSNSLLVDPCGGSLDKLYVKPNEFEIGSEKMFEGLLTVRNFVPFSSIVLKRSIIDDIGLFDGSLRSSSDLEWLLRIVRKYKTVGINEVLAKYRIHGTAISRDISLREETRIKILTSNMDKYEYKTNGFRNKLKHRIANSYYEWGYAEFEKSHLKSAREKFFKSIQYGLFNKFGKYFYYFSSFIPAQYISYLKIIKRKISNAPTEY